MAEATSSPADAGGEKAGTADVSEVPVSAPLPRSIQKERALDRCAAEHLQLMECLDHGGLFGTKIMAWCNDEQSAFWRCYKRERGGIRLRSATDILSGAVGTETTLSGLRI